MSRASKKELYERAYPVGTRIRCIQMFDPFAVPTGTCGTVTGVDDEPALLVNWDTGSTLKLYPDYDVFQFA